ncbi:uncharacterized protein BP01DRAFT_337262 [Aspergillus saccharolyticus JOP 1030-1]|uniref:HAUS augmin-like complex subunit 1 n=1 Tax=Aspergillus saccharolyticus JOP 1030-1 TaxID=1450539 RepID=A0A318ZH00_9EURO|nr:hypothetical protein BP01DRAFT_337262 [Aspergillus saccharolyticus JOP 1030-1]PYH46831.1 hypothetical protein BP01DRAFT_337262 [Aspergillus saccharolyticus JOP 1030-1]
MDSPLFSPAKARQAAIQAKDWAYVNAWLNRQYAPNPVPKFERNEDTLRTLLAMAAANDAADEEALTLHKAREEAVKAFKSQEEKEDKQKTEILDEIELSLDESGRQSLDDLAETTTVLGAISTDAVDLGQSIIDLTTEEFGMQEQMSRVEALQTYLEKELVTLREQLDDLKTNEAYETPADLPALTAEWTRNTKSLNAKAAASRDKIASLQRSRGKEPRLEDVIAKEAEVIELLETVKSLETKVNMFHDLPRDVPGAQAKCKELERELQRMIKE